MSKDRRAASFLFEPGRFYRDPKIMAMSVAARGVYAMLFCAGWDLPEPGIYPNDDRVLAQLAMCSPEEWAAARHEVMTAFDLGSGTWVQKGLVRTKLAQDRFVKAQAERGRLGANVTNSKHLIGGGAAIDRRSAAAANDPPRPTSVLGSRFSENPSPVGPPNANGAAKTKRVRHKAPPNRTITDADIAFASKRTGLDRAGTEHLAERIRLEGPQRGYLNYPSALLNWCRREVINAKDKATSDPYGPPPNIDDDP